MLFHMLTRSWHISGPQRRVIDSDQIIKEALQRKADLERELAVTQQSGEERELN